MSEELQNALSCLRVVAEKGTADGLFVEDFDQYPLGAYEAIDRRLLKIHSGNGWSDGAWIEITPHGWGVLGMAPGKSERRRKIPDWFAWKRSA